jgi:hypothetical protein
MTTEQIDSLADGLKRAMDEARQITEERDFYLRILKQIALQNGGEMKVDPSLGEAAQKEKRTLFFGGGWISLN